MSSFKTIVDVKDIVIKEKSSKFIGYGFYVSNEIQIKEKLELLKEIHPKANHYCYAYRLGLDKYNFRTNDDGEPSGTAGKPILGQIDSNGLTNCLVVVVRYFGGVKLGVSGLIDAYKETAKQTIDSTTNVEITIKEKYKVICNYLEQNKLYKIFSKAKATVIEQEIENECTFTIEFEKEKEIELTKILSEEGIYFVKVD
jgi:uncharacterized YigZ family protein